MTCQPPQFEELADLVWALANDRLDADGASNLRLLLESDAANRRVYSELMDQFALLEWERGEGEGRGIRDEGRGTWDEGRGMAGSPAIDLPVGAAVELPHQLDLEPQIPEPPFPALSTTNYPLPTSHFSVGSWAFSYMVATVIMGVAILGFWAYKITHHQHIAEAPSQSVPSEAMPEMVFVGRITGMVDVKWSDDPHYLPPPGYAHVPLGRKYILDAGLLEITYDSGAKVILQGPCTYEVESSAGGYLALGKLTARVEKERSEVRSQRSDPSPLSTNSNPQSLIPNPLFAIRTPTAIVTDLGTEFGVEVCDGGDTISRVFRGSVRLQMVGNDADKSAVVLRENESARVEKGAGGDVRLVLDGAAVDPPKFVRRLVKPPKLLDLLDIVAGGRGTGWHRERGIDPASGMEAPFFLAEHYFNVTQYQRVTWHRMIDGVFVPDGRRGPIQLDSAGHKFDGFPPTDGNTYGSIWARAADVGRDERTKNQRQWIYAMGDGGKFTPQRRGLLGMHSNVGITFDLEAIRRAHPGLAPTSFRAVGGLADKPFSLLRSEGRVDVWVFVDGRLKLKREKLRVEDGTFNLDVKLSPGDRFLTLAVTDFDMQRSGDRVVFGDPVLQVMMRPEEPAEKKKPPTKGEQDHDLDVTK